MSDPQRPPVLVVGIGNTLRRDDGIGVHIIRHLSRSPLPKQVEVVDGGTVTFPLLERFQARKKIIIVDAIEADTKPGTLFRLQVEDISKFRNCFSCLHQMSIVDVIDMFRWLYGDLPEVVFLAVQPKNIGVGMDISPELRECMDFFVDIIISEFTDYVYNG